MKRIGVDVGGTFTDLVAYDTRSGELVSLKVLTKPRKPWESVLEALDRLGWSLGEAELLVHATTLGTNMLLGQTGLEPPTVVLITNQGFRDVLEIGRQNRPSLYNLFFTRPPALVPRSRRLTVRGRLGPGGEELEPLDRDAVRAAAEEWCGRAEVFVAAFLHSYASPLHEEQAAETIRQACPGAEVVLSSRVDPKPGEYERTSTAVVNALLRPMFRRYLGELLRGLRERGFRGRLLVMQSSGGVASPEAVEEKPAAFIESGPAAGAAAAAYFSRLLGEPRLVGFDMGGTTAKAVAVLDGRPLETQEYEVGARLHMGRRLRGTGYPVRYPFIDIAEVSAGGGTVAWIDEGGALRVGPLSAGADPGPACYGRGGRDPTVTDAHLLLGRLPRALAGGRLALDHGAALRAYQGLAERLGMEPVEAAAAVIRIANTVMARALRLVTLERGLDPRVFVLLAYGGAGPLHAAELAAELGMRETIIPPMPGVFSALGLLVTRYRHDLEEAITRPAASLRDEELQRLFERLRRRAEELLRSEGLDPAEATWSQVVAMRYRGQAQEITIPYTGSVEGAVEEFHRRHEARYGYRLEAEVEVVYARLTVEAGELAPRLPGPRGPRGRAEPAGTRRVYIPGHGWEEARIYLWESLGVDAVLEAPAIVEAPDSTVYIPPGHAAWVDRHGAIHIVHDGG